MWLTLEIKGDVIHKGSGIFSFELQVWTVVRLDGYVRELGVILRGPVGGGMPNLNARPGGIKSAGKV